MRKKTCLYYLFSVFFLAFFSGKAKSDIASEPPVPYGDPFILLYEDTYYAYGTNAEDGIEVYTSDNLEYWKKESELALKSTDSWGDRWFWAPEVYYVEDKDMFYMYYSADEHICVATSDSPFGPFKQEKKQPMLKGEKSIDNSLFIDEDGTPYLYFDRFNDGLNIWVAELEDDLQTLKPETLKKCIHVSQEWEEVWPRVNEGPFVIKHEGVYYLTYSANSYESPFYGIGFATADSPTGPWTKYKSNPILQKPNDLVGVGHNAIFKDKKGNLKMVFHAHHNKDNIHPRAMYIADIVFTDDEVPAMEVLSDSILQAKIAQ